MHDEASAEGAERSQDSKSYAGFEENSMATDPFMQNRVEKNEIITQANRITMALEEA